MHPNTPLLSPPFRIVGFVLALSQIALTGCGGGSSSPPSPSAPPASTPAPLAILSQPASVSAAPGSSATFSVVATGRSAPSDGLGPAAKFNVPSKIAVTSSGTVYVRDVIFGRSTVDTIRKITPDGMVSTLAIPAAPLNVHHDGSAAQHDIVGLAADAGDNLYVATYAYLRGLCALPIPEYSSDCASCEYPRYAIRRITPAGVVSTVVTSESAYRDLQSQQPRFLLYSTTFQVDTDGTLYMATSLRNTADDPVAILAVSPAGITRKVSGNFQSNALIDGDANTAKFNAAKHLAIDFEHNLFVMDQYGFHEGNGYAIRKIAPDGRVTTIAGDGSLGELNLGPLPGRLLWLDGMAVDKKGSLFVGTSYGILKINL